MSKLQELIREVCPKINTTMKRHLLTFAMALAVSPAVFGQEESFVRFAYDVDFEMKFDNREYGQSPYSSSMTIFGARLTPSVGMDIKQKNGMRHRLMAGIDIMKDFGASSVPASLPGGAEAGETSRSLDNWNLFREIIFYYSLRQQLDRTDFSLTAGIFPRHFSKAAWPTSFFSDAVMFYDTNLEGLLMTFRRPHAYYEVGCDWTGQIGTARREKFMIFSNGEASLLPYMNIGYFAYMFHFANSGMVKGVVDNALVYPYLSFDFGSFASMQKLGFTLGYMQGVQQDRANVGKMIFPKGGELTLDARNWNVGLQYKLFYGNDMMPYYNSTDAGGIAYADRLYWGDPFYRVRADGSSGTYQRLEVYYEPHVADFVGIRAGAVLHFNEGFSGWQQIVSITFNLDRLLKSIKK